MPQALHKAIKCFIPEQYRGKQETTFLEYLHIDQFSQKWQLKNAKCNSSSQWNIIEETLLLTFKTEVIRLQNQIRKVAIY